LKKPNSGIRLAPDLAGKTFMITKRLINRAVPWLSRCFLLVVTTSLSGCIGVAPRVFPSPEPVQNLGHDWRKHFNYGVALLEKDHLVMHKTVFTRAAFSTAARFARDHAPSYAGLGLANLELGYYAEAQTAFLNAALIDDRSLYWALATLSALRNGNERVARTLFDAMQAARVQDDDPASEFIRGVYLADDKTFLAPLVAIPWQPEDRSVDPDLMCNSGSEEALCRGLNVVASVYFVRRSSSDAVTRGTDFFNNLSFRLGAESSFERPKGDGLTALHEATLSLPELQYALRLTPQSASSNLFLNAAPSVVTSIGEESEIREGSNLTILYNSSGYSDEFTAETGISLRIQPEEATMDFVKLKLNFELSSVSTLVPSLAAQVLDVSSNQYTISGYFPYGRPVVLGTISSGTQKQSSSGQIGLRRLPLLGSNFGQSRDETFTSDTLVLGILSEPIAFRGSHEHKLLEAMRAMGINIPAYGEIRRRKVVHQAPDISVFLTEFLKHHARSMH
jgi:hypothetical protein